MDKILYTTRVTASGGRNGVARADDAKTELALAMPKALGGNGEGLNPEQLFGAGYAACFSSSLQFVAAKRGVVLEGLAVTAQVNLRQTEKGFVVDVELRVAAKEPVARVLIEEADRACAYSNAMRGEGRVSIEAVQ